MTAAATLQAAACDDLVLSEARSSEIEQLKPVTPRIARWAWWFFAAGWELTEVADLFDCCPEALGRAVKALP